MSGKVLCIPGWEPQVWSNGAPDYWSSLRELILERDDYACVYCGSTEKLHVDHIIPRSKGGRDTLGNLTTACARCNLAKSAFVNDDLRQWVARREAQYADTEAAVVWGWLESCAETGETVPEWVRELAEVDQ